MMQLLYLVLCKCSTSENVSQTDSGTLLLGISGRIEHYDIGYDQKFRVLSCVKWDLCELMRYFAHVSFGTFVTEF